MFKILYDVAGLPEESKYSGIPKFTYNLAKSLLKMSDETIHIEICNKFVTSKRLKEQILDLEENSLGEDEKIELNVGDVYFLPHNCYFFEINDMIKLIESGLCVIPFLHDIIPITHPQFCLKKDNFYKWIIMISMMETGLICNSLFSVSQFFERIHYKYPIGYVHLGIEENITLQEMELPKGKNVLMVSTIEPRKKYNETLSAFERIWEVNNNINLIIVGATGWDPETTHRIYNHSKRNKNLFHLQNISEEKLNYLYKHCDLFLFASDVEGFGLGIIEAGRFETPLLLRDIPVFREIAGDFATYFKNFDELDSIIIKQFELGFKKSTGMKINTWNDTSKNLIKIIEKIRTNFLNK
jgi:glycosyltransferase involved in cell wall biosynthesis